MLSVVTKWSMLHLFRWLKFYIGINRVLFVLAKWSMSYLLLKRMAWDRKWPQSEIKNPTIAGMLNHKVNRIPRKTTIHNAPCKHCRAHCIFGKIKHTVFEMPWPKKNHSVRCNYENAGKGTSGQGSEFGKGRHAGVKKITTKDNTNSKGQQQQQ